MKNRLLITVTALLLAATPLLRAADEPKTPLGEKMTAVNDAYKVARKSINDGAETADTLALVSKAKAALEASLMEKPPAKNLDLVPEAKKAEYLKGYDADMHKMIALFGKLEAALKEKNNAAAKAVVTEIDAQQKSSHSAYRAKPKV